MRRPVVMKFGGTSVAGAAAMRQVCRLVSRAAEAGDPVVVVVSAMSGVTDALLAACHAARDNDADAATRRVADVQERHEAVIEELFGRQGGSLPPEGGSYRLETKRVWTKSVWTKSVWLPPLGGSESLSAAIVQQCDDVRAVLGSVAVLRELTPRGADRVAAAGELMSSRIVAALLQETGIAARWIDARKTIVTDEAFGAAAPLEATQAAARRQIVPALDAGQVAVVGGYVGATADGITTTLGRGGSDYSAAIIGGVLDAREIQIWTDVDGMLTADPRVIADAQPVARLSFEEAAELAYFGAKVLHPSTILPAVEKNIPVRILNTMRPDNSGSLIAGGSGESRSPLTAVACKRNVTVVNVTSTRMLLAHGFLKRVFEVFAHHDTSVDVVTTSEVSVSMTLDDDSCIEAIQQDLSGFAEVQVERGMAIVSAVGDSLRADPALAVSVIAALGRLPLRMVSQAASRRNVTVVLDDAYVPDAMSRLHAEFFATAGARE